MYGYAASSATASNLTPFSPPPQTTNAAGGSAQAAAVVHAAGTAAGTHAQTLPQLMSAVPQTLQSLSAPISSAAPAAADPPSPLMTIDSFLTGPLSPLSLFSIGGVPYLLAFQSYLLPQAAANLTSAAEKMSALPAAAGGGLPQGGIGSGARLVGTAGGAVAAGMGRAGLVGGLCVPQGWASAAPAIKTAAAMLPDSGLSAAPAALETDGQGGLFSSMALSGLAGRAMVGTGGGAARSAGMGGAAAVGETATTANIFVIPEADE